MENPWFSNQESKKLNSSTKFFTMLSKSLYTHVFAKLLKTQSKLKRNHVAGTRSMFANTKILGQTTLTHSRERRYIMHRIHVPSLS